jgi:hypothetical protein
MILPKKTQMSNPPEAASYHNSTKILILLPLRAIYFYSLYYETPCIITFSQMEMVIIVELMLQDGWMEPIQQLWEKMS